MALCRPHLILLDLLMPEMDGFVFIRELRKTPAWRAIPIVVVSALQLTEPDRQRLHGSVQKILQKQACGHDEWLREVRELVSDLHRQPSSRLDLR
jgi:CheY-like chemotaxis protein